MKLGALAALVSVCGAAMAAEGEFDSNGVKIRYVSEGEGEAVVLIHGWMSDSSMWGRDSKGNTKLNTEGTPGMRIIALDCRGHGKSGKPHDRSQYGPEMANDIIRLLDHLGIQRAHLAGYSMGAFIAGYVAAHHPDRVISVIYAGQAPLLAGADNSSPEVDAFADAVAKGEGLGEYIIASTPAGRPKPSLEQANAWARIAYGGKDVEALAAAGKSFPALAVDLSKLAQANARTLFVYGDKEPDALKKRVEIIRAALAGSELKVIADADHITTLAKPEFRKAFVEFLKQKQQQSAAP